MHEKWVHSFLHAPIQSLPVRALTIYRNDCGDTKISTVWVDNSALNPKFPTDQSVKSQISWQLQLHSKLRWMGNSPTLGQCAIAICRRRLRACNLASSQPSTLACSSMFLSNSEKPKLLYHSGLMRTSQEESKHRVCNLKCTMAHQGWYKCLQLATIASLYRKPNLQNTQCVIWRRSHLRSRGSEG